MNKAQTMWLSHLKTQIVSLLKDTKKTDRCQALVLGTRQINGKQIALKLVVNYIDPATNPLSTHSSNMLPAATPSAPSPTRVTKPTRPRARKNRARYSPSRRDNHLFVSSLPLPIDAAVIVLDFWKENYLMTVELQ